MLIINLDGRACTVRAGRIAERREKKRRTRERERARKGCEEIRACEAKENQRGIRRREGERKEKVREFEVWVLKNAEERNVRVSR